MKLTALVLATSLLGGQALADTSQQTPLLPAVKALLAMPAIDKSTLDQNAYVYFLGMNAAGDHYQEVGKKIVLYNEVLIKQALASHKAEWLMEAPDKQAYHFAKANPAFDTKLKGVPYKYPCSNLEKLNCLAEVINQQEVTSTLAQQNRLYLERYVKLIQLPRYNNYYSLVASPLPYYPYLIVLSGLRQAEAVEAISKGEIARGLTILQEEITFSKRMLAGHMSLIDAMVAIRLLMIQYHTLSELIDLPMMAKELNNPQLLALFKPLTHKEQQALVAVFQNELTWQLQFFAAIDKSYIATDSERLQKEGQAKPRYPLTYHRNKSLNLIYEAMADYIKQAAVTLPEAASVYTALRQTEANRKPLSEEEIYQQYGADNFYTGWTLAKEKLDRYQPFFYRFYDVSNYLALVNAKLAIKQAHISKAQVATFLETLADKAQNPYSKKPFRWNQQTQILSSDWLATPGVDMLTEVCRTRARVKLMF